MAGDSLKREEFSKLSLELRLTLNTVRLHQLSGIIDKSGGKVLPVTVGLLVGLPQIDVRGRQLAED
jgi:hypothetical protein